MDAPELNATNLSPSWSAACSVQRDGPEVLKAPASTGQERPRNHRPGVKWPHVSQGQNPCGCFSKWGKHGQNQVRPFASPEKEGGKHNPKNGGPSCSETPMWVMVVVTLLEPPCNCRPTSPLKGLRPSLAQVEPTTHVKPQGANMALGARHQQAASQSRQWRWLLPLLHTPGEAQAIGHWQNKKNRSAIPAAPWGLSFQGCDPTNQKAPELPFFVSVPELTFWVRLIPIAFVALRLADLAELWPVKPRLVLRHLPRIEDLKHRGRFIP